MPNEVAGQNDRLTRVEIKLEALTEQFVSNSSEVKEDLKSHATTVRDALDKSNEQATESRHRMANQLHVIQGQLSLIAAKQEQSADESKMIKKTVDEMKADTTKRMQPLEEDLARRKLIRAMVIVSIPASISTFLFFWHEGGSIAAWIAKALLGAAK